MIHRFFKLIYIFALAAIVLSLPIYLFSEIKFDLVVYSTYRAKCLSNNQYIILEGANTPYEFDDWILRNQSTDDKRDLNFYCQYYNEILPYVVAYNNGQEVEANREFFKFKDPLIKQISQYPALYKLEVVNEEVHLSEIFIPLLVWLIFAGLTFLFLQLLRICYIYIVFGKIVWHPFNRIK
jgi:hypothetical protein